MRDTLNASPHEGHKEPKGFFFESFVPFVLKIFTPENIWAFVLFLIVIALIVFTTDSSPAWIYQGF
jgi:hypothetical protein